MGEHEYDSIKQMQGSMSRNAVPQPGAFERANYMKVLKQRRHAVALRCPGMPGIDETGPRRRICAAWTDPRLSRSVTLVAVVPGPLSAFVSPPAARRFASPNPASSERNTAGGSVAKF